MKLEDLLTKEEIKNLDIIDQLSLVRKRKKISQRELSSKTGIPQKTISRVENKLESPRLTTLIGLAVGLDMTIDLIKIEE